jgi:diadenosine tetraphosphatase ApaH/serine/threonine PP2A family protein phosphatase
VPLDPPGKVLVNVGSVGQPRDSNPAASFAVVDLVKARVHFKRADYDIKSAARKIIEAGLPASLAERLFLGY